jgi:hypothetical protein
MIFLRFNLFLGKKKFLGKKMIKKKTFGLGVVTLREKKERIIGNCHFDFMQVFFFFNLLFCPKISQQ